MLLCNWHKQASRHLVFICTVDGRILAGLDLASDTFVRYMKPCKYGYIIWMLMIRLVFGYFLRLGDKESQLAFLDKSLESIPEESQFQILTLSFSPASALQAYGISVALHIHVHHIYS